MDAKIIAKEKLPALLELISRDYRLIAPVREEDTVTLFKQVAGGREVDLDYHNSNIPPKAYLFPQSEKILSYVREPGSLEIREPGGSNKQVLFGVRPCDVKSILALDPVFNGAFPDEYYRDKRENTTLVALSCTRVMPTCFCGAFGSGPCDSRGADLMFTDLGEQYYVEIVTDKGLALVDLYRELFSGRDLEKAAAAKDALALKLSNSFYRQVDLTGVKEVLDCNFDLPYWEEISRKCIGCGICTFVCPTCHCFDIFDHTFGRSEGSRFRCWDSCMFPDFTRMAGGHNPRPTKKERVRNRFMHKLKYHQDRYGLDGCVGCGRCIDRCPVNMDITRIISDIKEVGSSFKIDK
ncbi:MAG: 4Fe-4S dicluster domain-containing protein [Firmicutes bacterium]|nr:4Fe-4S dicluster domain-containing protein [Bacillota bacterium]